VPEHDARIALAEDYAHIVNDGPLLGSAEPFDGEMRKSRQARERRAMGNILRKASPFIGLTLIGLPGVSIFMALSHCSRNVTLFLK
jgi:hypothetical protein